VIFDHTARWIAFLSIAPYFCPEYCLKQHIKNPLLERVEEALCNCLEVELTSIEKNLEIHMGKALSE
jgi:hypothetical protein